MSNRTQVIEQIFKAIDEVNLQLPTDQHVAKKEEALLIGIGGVLSSLGFLNLIVATEENVRSFFNTSIALASSLMELEPDHFPQTVAALADVICTHLKDCGHE